AGRAGTAGRAGKTYSGCCRRRSMSVHQNPGVLTRRGPLACGSVKILVVVTATLVLAAAVEPGAQADRSRLATAFADVDRLFTDVTKQAHVPGAAWGIIVDGELVHAGASGIRDIASKAPVDADTVFRIASMTKSFTAMAILRLRDEGKLSLDDLAER